MSKTDYYILKNFLKELENLNYDYNDLEKTDIWKFRYICYKFNYFIKYIVLPDIKINSFYEAVFIDFRILPNIEFIIRNAILKLGIKWSFTIICGNENYDYINEIKKNIGKNIKIIKLEYNNLSQEEYSNLLTTESFWNLFYGEKILIYQEDSLIFHKNIDPFLDYDFIGAPFQKNSNDTPNGVGNGGLSIRTKCKMLEVIKKCKLEETIVNSHTLNYMKTQNLKYPPEDVYFSKNMQELLIGEVADWNKASLFSSEQVFNPNSFGGHQFWQSNENWQFFMKKIFEYKKYNSKSGLNKYLKLKNLPLVYNNNNKIENAFDVDLKFFCYINNIEYINHNNALIYLYKIGLDGFIYHPKQLLNIFGDIEFYKFLKNIYTFYNKKIYTIKDFVNKYIYNSSFDFISDLTIKKKFDTLNDNYNTILLVFIGNEEIGIDLINRIINYKKINKSFNISFCINKTAIKNVANIKKLIRDNFDFYAVYYSKEFGTDITPTLLMYNDIIKNHNIEHILKFHTKTISDLYNNLTNYLLSNPINKIIENKHNKSNCIGPLESYINIIDDKFNNSIKNKYKDYIHENYYFVAGTIFYTKNEVFYKVLDFIKNNNYRSYLLNNLYENNSINQDFSPIHFLERLFGSIRL
jgi:hypothetical protein